MDKNEILKSLGLTEYESQIYISLLEKGVSGISKISRETGINRPAIYKIIPTLLGKGIVTEVIKKKQKLYSAENPEKLEAILENVQKRFKNALPELLQDYEGIANKPIVKFLSGKHGISFIFEDLVRTLKKGDIFYRYSAPRDLSRAEKYLPENYRKIRDEKQLERFVITGESIAEQKKPRLERDIRILSNIEENDFNITQIIYANKIALINYESETAVLIEDRLTANFQKMIFKTLYARL
ncbi:MAG: helix-turn-helix domain-containing protein [bacterium]|nr:helix-turn-helix domain-containing protein [bacterium]